METTISHWLTLLLGADFARSYAFPVTLAAVGVIAWLSYEIFRRGVSPIILKAVSKTSTKWDNDILTPEVLRACSQLIPAIVVAWLLPRIFLSHEALHVWVKKLTLFYIVWACVHLINTVIGAIFTAFENRNMGKIHSLKGTFQMVKLIVICVAIIVGAGILFDRSPLTILTAFGASAAVLMLVFRDTILGLVAGVQLTANNMLHKGDWIVCDKAKANGEVIDISLTTVKVRNWDNSVITIPPYNLISDSFQNYQPMRTSGGRRVARYVYIDVNSVRFLNPDEIHDLRKEGLLHGDNRSEKIVNLGVFRHHMEEWLRKRKDIVVRKGRTMFVMVRQLQPTPQGIPLELYFFTSKTDWAAYEEVQSEIFDYVYATIRRFHLRLYQAPSGLDLKSISAPKP